MSIPPRSVRYQIVFVLLALAAVGLVVAYARIMVFGESPSRPQPERTVERGPILDRNGEVLAIQTRLHTVGAWRPDVVAPQETAERLAPILNVPAESLTEELTEDNGFSVLQRRISPSQTRRIEELLTAGKLPGISLRSDTGRSYPHKTHAAHVLGYVGTENAGLAGMEYALDSTLAPRPEPGGKQERSAYGNQVFLTLDLNIQAHMDELARRTLAEHDADSVMILTMRARTGELLSYSSYPTFDPNRFEEFGRSVRKNRPISLIYEPGSVFKIFSISSFLELGGITPEDRFLTDGTYADTEADFLIRDLGDYGEVGPMEIIKYSSNVGAAYASETVSPEGFYRKIRDFGFGRETGIVLPGEEQGIVRPPGEWSARTQQTMAIGQELAVTALQVVAGATAFANDGMLLRPRLIRKIVSPEGTVIEDYSREPVRRVVSKQTAERMLQYMHAATQDGGTARRLQIDGIRISAKTGTAQVFDKEKDAYSDTLFVASTLAILPTGDPSLIVYVVIEHPRGDSVYGGRIAAPVVKEAAQFLIPYLGISRETDEVLAHPGTVTVRRVELPQFSDTLPDFRGLPKRALLPLLRRDNLDVRIEGSGWVTDQEPPAGTEIHDGMTLKLRLQ